jgi:hypothetical protein
VSNVASPNFDFFTAVFRHAPANANTLVRWGPVQPVFFVPLSSLFDGSVSAGEGNVFFGPALRKSEDSTKSGVLGASAAWLDFDNEEGSNAIALLPPSIMVASGGPGKFHYYWLMDRFVSPDQLERINKAIATHHNDRGGTWDCTRILRVPGSQNLKYNPARIAEIKMFVPQRVYPPEELEKLQAFDPAVLRVPDGRSRSERDFRLAKLLASWGMSDASIEVSLRTYSDKAKEEWRTYLPRTITRARESLTRSGKTLSREDKNLDVAPRKVRHLANFYAMPVASLVSSTGSDEGIMMEVGWGEGKRRLRAVQSDFDSRKAVNTWLTRNGLQTRMWLGNDKDASDFWVACCDIIPDETVLLVPQAGRHTYKNATMFVYGKENALCTPACNRLPVLWSSPVSEQREVFLPETPELLPQEDALHLINTTLKLNVPEVIIPALGWVMATPIKPLIETCYMRFPLLLLFGQRGSGKTSLLRDGLLPLIGGVTPLGSDVTRFALLSALSSYNAIPVWLGEFRASLPNTDELQTYLRMAYDGAREERGRSNQTVAVYEMTAPVVVDGETMFPDSAVRERTLPVRLIQANILRSGYTVAMKTLREIHQLQPLFARDYLQHTLSTTKDDVSRWIAQGEIFFSESIPQSRLVSAATTAYIGIKLLQTYVPVDLTDKEIVSAILKTMDNVYVHGLGVRTPVEQMLEILSHAFRAGQTWAIQACEYKEGVLWFNVTTCHHWIRRFWFGLPEKEMLMPQIDERVGIYIETPKVKDGGIYYGLNIAKAQELGLDVPTPISLTIKRKGEVTL